MAVTQSFLFISNFSFHPTMFSKGVCFICVCVNSTSSVTKLSDCWSKLSIKITIWSVNFAFLGPLPGLCPWPDPQSDQLLFSCDLFQQNSLTTPTTSTAHPCNKTIIFHSDKLTPFKIFWRKDVQSHDGDHMKLAIDRALHHNLRL